MYSNVYSGVDVSEVLKHYGVKGMKWGVHKYDLKSTKYHNKALNAKNDKKHAKYMSKALNAAERSRLMAKEGYDISNKKLDKAITYGSKKAKIAKYKEHKELFSEAQRAAEKYIYDTYNKYNANNFVTSARAKKYSIRRGHDAIAAIGGLSYATYTMGSAAVRYSHTGNARRLRKSAAKTAAAGALTVGYIRSNKRVGTKYKVKAVDRS